MIMPSAMYRLKLSSATDEQIDQIQSPLRQVIAMKAHITAAHTNVLFGGYRGCGWKRWRDEAGIIATPHLADGVAGKRFCVC
jgi:hypothetical protein